METLTQLRACLQLLLDISDLQNSIDDHYVPIERMYELLRYVRPPVLMVFNFPGAMTNHHKFDGHSLTDTDFEWMVLNRTYYLLFCVACSEVPPDVDIKNFQN